ncbi:MAG: bacillithiol biosynthesis protein BshC, partial [Cyclonatronaceae bacterium]
VDYVKKRNLYAQLSPNVFLRPVLQQYMLPNIGYAGGPAEVAYHAQMKPVFEHFRVPMPVILSRFSATLIEPSIARAAKALPFEFGTYRQPAHVLINTYLNERAALNPEGFFAEWRQSSRELMEQRLGPLAGLHDSLKTSTLSTQQRIEHHLSELEKKVREQLKEQERVQIKRIKRVQQHLFPGQSLQEREYGWLYFINAYGTDWMEDVLEAMRQKPFLLLQKHHYLFL